METAVPAIDTRIMIAGMRVPSVFSIAGLRAPRLGAVGSMLATGSTLVAASSMLVLVGCSGGDQPEATSGETSPLPETATEAPVVADVIPMGTVEGVVRLAPGAALPGYDTNPMISAGASAAMPSDCPPPNESDRQPVQVGSSGGLTNLVIVATGDPEHWPDTAGPRTRTARIERCRLEPRTLVAERGDTIHFETELNFPFFPDLGTGFSRALLPTDPLDLVLDQGGVRTIGCAFANACGRMEVVTIYHPVFAVSDAEGRFRMTNVPADQDIRVTAWHPLFQEIAGTTRVEPGQTVQLELVIQPIASAAPAPPPEPTTPRDPLEGDIPE